MFSIFDGRESFYQWDLNQKLIVYDDSITAVHFCNKSDDCALVCEVYDYADGLRVVDVPNILLQAKRDIRAYGVAADYTEHYARFTVVSRSRPADYVYTETEVMSWQALDASMRAFMAEVKDELENGELKGDKGDKGDPGEPGLDGTTITDITATKPAPGPDGSGAFGGYVNVRTARPDGTDAQRFSFWIPYGKDGDKGDKGDPGKDGYTPVKGVDYFDGKDGQPGADGKDYVLTEADKAEIAEQAAQLVDVPEGGMGGADWNAAEGEPGHVANRTHWVDMEEVPLDFTFDGDITGKETINMGGAMLVKISNAVIPMDDLMGATATLSDGSVIVISDENTGDVLGDGSIIGNDGVFAVQRNCTFNGIAFTAGLYSVYMETDGLSMYVTSLVKEGATVMCETVHKLDSKFLPDNIGGNGGLFVVIADTSSMTADKTADEILEAMMGGKTVLLAVGNQVLPCVGCEPGQGAFFLAIGSATQNDVIYDIVSLGIIWIKHDGSIVLKARF